MSTQNGDTGSTGVPRALSVSHTMTPQPTGNLRTLGITLFVSRKDVEHALGCSRSTAAMHLRKAAGKTDSSRTLVRVSVERWEQYVKEVFGCPSGSVSTSGQAVTYGSASSTNVTAPAARGLRSATITKPPKRSSGSGNVTPLIRVTPPRGKQR